MAFTQFSDFDKFVDALISRESTLDTLLDKETEETVQKKLNSMAKGHEIWRKCTEGLSTPRAKRHRGENSNVEFLKEKMEKDMEMREKSLN